MRAKARRIDQIISALLETNGNIKAAAALLEAGEVTIWRYLKDAEFLRRYREARGKLLEITLGRISGYVDDALTTLHQIVQDPWESAAARVSASRVIVDIAIRGQELEALKSRIEVLEERLSK